MYKLVAAISAVIIMALPASAQAAGYNSAQNHPSYWGENCIKIEQLDNIYSYTTTDPDVTKVIIKGGTKNAVYTDGNFSELTAAINPRSGKPYGISHVITCSEPQTIDICVYNDQISASDEDCIPEETQCEYNHELNAEHPDCQPSTPTPPAVTPPSTPAVLSTSSTTQPAVLANTGVETVLSPFVGFGLASSALGLLVSSKRK